MLLSGPEIKRQMAAGIVKIDPVPPDSRFNPNSVNLTLDHRIKVYRAQLNYLEWVHSLRHSLGHYVAPDALFTKEARESYPDKLQVPPHCILDPWKKNETVDLEIPPDGRTLIPGIVYIAATVEKAGSDYPFAPMIEGRSTWARLALQTHQTGAWGDVAFQSSWVLEIVVLSPVLIKPGCEICQIAFHRVEGEVQNYDGRYKDQTGPVAAIPLPT